MEFPISRSRLQNYKVNEAVSAETKHRVMSELKNICKAVETKVLSTNEPKYIYRISEQVKYGEMRPRNSPVSRVDIPGILKELLSAIKNTFPDSTITVDPLESYIVIDWS